jgi:DNA (cytosine-5)-methyltransferase 1
MPSLIDFFCGAGGFSEGFRQMGFKIIYGYDSWKPAVDTFNHNFKLQCNPKNILDFKSSIEEINNIPDTDVIIGSPPCVSFSSSNKSGKADKSLGVELTETFLRIVAIKKHQPKSILKAWFMENVVNSKRYLQPEYTFKDLGLAEWACEHRISPLKIAVSLYENSTIINSAEYGAFQIRKRIISGEIIKKQKLIVPETSHSDNPACKKETFRVLDEIKKAVPSPFSKLNNELIKDPQYGFDLELPLLTDHFYDSGVYKVEWSFSKFWKTNHPYMGKMSFPENENKPSRTITATKIANSRESILYKSEYERKGDGEYRLPTVREAAIIMGFPLTYQFSGSEGTKWRLIGNAVCCSVSRAFACLVLDQLKIKRPSKPEVAFKPELNGIINLNTFRIKTFDNPPIKKKGSRFRRHVIKDGNLTVTLSNYDIEKNGKYTGKWYTSIQYGNGKGFPIQHIEDNFFPELEGIINSVKCGNQFLNRINNGFSEKIASSNILQDLYEKQESSVLFLEPTELFDTLNDILQGLNNESKLIKQGENRVFEFKDEVPINQFFALYAINKISTIANGN